MAREFGRLLIRAWRDDDFLDRSPLAKLLFALLLSQENISSAGVLPLQPKKWANLMGGGTTAEQVVGLLRELQNGPRPPFILADFDTEEVLVRTVIRNDKMAQGTPKVQKGAIDACETVHSPWLREWLASELEQCVRRAHSSVQERLGEMVEILRPPESPDSQSDSQPEGFGKAFDSEREACVPVLVPVPVPVPVAHDEKNENDEPCDICGKCGTDLVPGGVCPGCDPVVAGPVCTYDGCLHPAKLNGLCAQHDAVQNWKQAKA